MPRARPKEASTTSTNEVRHQVMIGEIEFWSDDWTPRELVQSLEDLPSRRVSHFISIDAGVRQYLLELLRDHLPPGVAGGRKRRIRRVKREVPA
jgi:hypothetical protein